MSDNIRKVKEMLNIAGPGFDSFFNFCEANLSNKIKIFCNIENIPEDLNTLIQEFLIEQYTLNKDGTGTGVIIATSASDKGQTVNFKTIGGASEMSKNVDEFLDRNMNTLVVYRKIRW